MNDLPPMHDDLAMLGFVSLFVLLASALHLFFRTFRLHEKRPRSARRVLLGNSLTVSFLLSLLTLGGELYFHFWRDATDSLGLALLTQRWFLRHFHPNTATFRGSIETYDAHPNERAHAMAAAAIATFLGGCLATERR